MIERQTADCLSGASRSGNEQFAANAKVIGGVPIFVDEDCQSDVIPAGTQSVEKFCALVQDLDQFKPEDGRKSNLFVRQIKSQRAQFGLEESKKPLADPDSQPWLLKCLTQDSVCSQATLASSQAADSRQSHAQIKVKECSLTTPSPSQNSQTALSADFFSPETTRVELHRARPSKGIPFKLFSPPADKQQPTPLPDKFSMVARV